jgi:hypothetical protein
MATELSAAHRPRLMKIWRSAGWPCQDMLEVELLPEVRLQRLRDAGGRETLRVTESGIALLAQTRQKNRALRDAHELLVERVAREMQRAGRIVWRGRACVRASATAGRWPCPTSIRSVTPPSRLTWRRSCTRSR